MPTGLSALGASSKSATLFGIIAGVTPLSDTFGTFTKSGWAGLAPR